MRPTGLGVKAALFYVLLVMAFFAAPYANSFFLLITFLTVLAGVGLFSGAFYARALGGELDEIQPAPAGTGPALSVVGVRRDAVVTELELEGCGKVKMAGTAGRLEPLPRGVYRVLKARMATSWPLGLVKFVSPLAAPPEIIIYPAPAALEEAPGGGGSLGELLAPSGMPAGYLQPSGLREFRPGDDQRRIHWKASARRGDLVLQEWEGGRGDGEEVVLDRRCEIDPLEDALSILAAAAQLAREDKQTLTLHTQGLSATFGGTHRPWNELLRFLAAATTLPASAPPPPTASPHLPRLPR